MILGLGTIPETFGWPDEHQSLHYDLLELYWRVLDCYMSLWYGRGTGGHDDAFPDEIDTKLRDDDEAF